MKPNTKRYLESYEAFCGLSILELLNLTDNIAERADMKQRIVNDIKLYYHKACIEELIKYIRTI
jgi:hypothetical protein